MTPEEIAAVLSRAQEQPSWDTHRRTQLDEVIAAFEDRYLLATHVKAQDAEIKRLRKHHADLTSRLGFGDGVTEPQADNDTIVDAMERQASEAAEWQESQSWRTDCYLAGHPDDEDCAEHDPTLRLINAEAEIERLRAQRDEASREVHRLNCVADDLRAQVAAVERVRDRYKKNMDHFAGSMFLQYCDPYVVARTAVRDLDAALSGDADD